MNLTANIDALIAEVNSMSQRVWKCPTLGELPSLGSWEDDENVLFANNFLSKGQSMALVASSGVGKSSMAMQEAYHWALGRTFLASPKRPLKIAYIQTEDSPRDVDEQRMGMRRGLIEQCNWTAEDVMQAESNIYMPQDFIGVQGDDFISLLRELQGDMDFDLITLNPLQGVYGDDLSDQRAVSHFCRAGLDPIMKDERHPCILNVVMHTGKQKSGNKEGRADVTDYGEYMMAGSQEWTAWSRAIFSFLKSKNNSSCIDLTCPKRGHVLRWSKPKRMFQRCDDLGYIFWREVVEIDNEIADKKTPKVPDVDPEMVAKTIADIIDYLHKHDAVRRSTFVRDPRDCTTVKIKNRIIARCAVNAIVTNMAQYKLSERYLGVGDKRTMYIGFAEGLRNAEIKLKQQREINLINAQKSIPRQPTPAQPAQPAQPTQPTQQIISADDAALADEVAISNADYLDFQ